MAGPWPDQPRMLISYAYRKTLDQVLAAVPPDHPLDLIVDSGAFTAATLGKPVNIDEYCDYLTQHADRISHAASLDVIGDWRATARNYDRMRARIGDSFPLLPAWHLGSPTTELDRLCREHDYVAIGGCVPYGKRPKLLMQHLIGAHRTAQRHNTRLHGLGVTGKTAMVRLPWYSVDSSAWEQGNRFGGISLANRDGTLTTIRFSQPLNQHQRRLIRTYDGNPNLVAAKGFNQSSVVGSRSRQDRAWINQAASRTFMVMEGAVRTKHRSQLRIHLAGAAVPHLLNIIPAWEMGSPW